MPNKLWSNLKDPTSRRSAEEWAKALRIPDLTSSEWRNAGEYGPGKSDAEIRQLILAARSNR